MPMLFSFCNRETSAQPWKIDENVLFALLPVRHLRHFRCHQTNQTVQIKIEGLRLVLIRHCKRFHGKKTTSKLRYKQRILCNRQIQRILRHSTLMERCALGESQKFLDHGHNGYHSIQLGQTNHLSHEISF